MCYIVIWMNGGAELKQVLVEIEYFVVFLCKVFIFFYLVDKPYVIHFYTLILHYFGKTFSSEMYISKNDIVAKGDKEKYLYKRPF